jgi:hypothetical protein
MPAATPTAGLLMLLGLAACATPDLIPAGPPAWREGYAAGGLRQRREWRRTRPTPRAGRQATTPASGARTTPGTCSERPRGEEPAAGRDVHEPVFESLVRVSAWTAGERAGGPSFSGPLRWRRRSW